MKNFARILSLALALGAASFLAGCAGYRSTKTTQRAVNASDFEVVETSTKRLLTTQEMLQLKIAVAKYLDKEGAVASGDYYVKVFLGPDQDGVPADWVVVRFTRDTNTRFSLLASYPATTPGYQPYAAYDYYPYGYDHFSRISFQYYNDPYYGSRYYFPPRRHNRDRDNDRDHDRGKDRDGDNPRSTDRPRFKPIDPVGTPPQVTGNRGDGNRGDGNRGDGTRGDGRSSGRNYQPRGDNTSSRDATSERPPAADRPSGGGYATRSDLHRRDQPRSEPVRQESPRSEPVRQESTRSEAPARSNESYSAPSYSEPARSEPSSSSSSSHRETNESASRRQRLE